MMQTTKVDIRGVVEFTDLQAENDDPYIEEDREIRGWD